MSYSLFLKDLIKKYNADPNGFASDSMFVKSYQVGQSTYFKKVTNSSFWAIRENEALFWLVPKSKLSITEFNRDAIEEVFVCRNHDSKSDGKKFTLIRPVKLELVPETGDLAFQEKGILDFGMVSEIRLTDLEYWVSETEDILVQSLTERITDQFNESMKNESMKNEIEAIKSELARLDHEQHNHISSPLYFDNWVKINVEKEKLKTELRTVFTEKFALLDKFTQFVDRFTPVLCFIEQKFQQLQQDQKRTQAQPRESSTDTKPVPSKMETNVAVNAPKKVRHSDMPRDIVQMVEIFNTNASDFIYRYQNISVSVAEDRKSSIDRLKGDEQQIYFEAHIAGSFIAVMDDFRNIHCEVYWLVPKPNTRPNEFKAELWQKLFGYEGQSFTQYTLVTPAKISNLENGKRFILDCAGEIDFS